MCLFYCTWLRVIAQILQFVVCFFFFLNKGFALRDVVITLCLCVLISHPASGLRENIEVRISKANDLLGSFKLLLLQLEADDVFANKTSATEETACGVTLPLSQKKKSAFLLLFSVCVPLCVRTVLLHVFVYEMSHRRWMRGSLLHVAPPGLMDSQSLSAASANIDQAKRCAVQEQKERKKERTSNLLPLCYI